MTKGDEDEWNPLIVSEDASDDGSTTTTTSSVPPRPAADHRRRFFPRQFRCALSLLGVLGALYVAGDQILWGRGGGTPDQVPVNRTTVGSEGADGGKKDDADAWGQHSNGDGPRLTVRPTAPAPAPPPGPAPDATSVTPPEPAPDPAAGDGGGDEEEEEAESAGDGPGNDVNGGDATASSDDDNDDASASSSSLLRPPALPETYGSTFPQGFRPHPNAYSESYLPRARPLRSAAAKERLTDEWGSWTFVDPSASRGLGRPDDDYYVNYPSRDVPRIVFPPNAWQIDPEYLSAFLPEAKALVRRTMEAILAEYGHGTAHEPSRSFEERSDMFRVTISNVTTQELYLSDGEGSTRDAGGCMSPKAHDGLVRRILHAMVTEDTFRIATGGHSAATGHGNHFQQSYTLQVQHILEPVFARLGVTMTAHNLAMGGLGTLQSAMGKRDLYGDDVDILVYDSGMTEKQPYALDLFLRQGILGGAKVPLLWANQDNRQFFRLDSFQYLAEECDADVAAFGSGLRGVPLMESPTEAEGMPWAAQYLKCDPSIKELCREKEYMGTCWYERDDVTPSTTQRAEPGQRVSFHPGNRFHQLHGRVLAFIILTATERAIDVWSKAKAYALEDSDWHMNAYYSNIRRKLQSLRRNTSCHEQEFYPPRVCDLPLRARSEFTPRQNPYETSIRSIVKGGNLAKQVRPNLYDPPDVHNPNLDPGGLDVLRIAENGGTFGSLLGRRRRIAQRELYESKDRIKGGSVNSEIEPGRGWELVASSAPDNCDGSYDAFCGRSEDSDCLLYGHNAFRGGLKFDSLSGWLILNLEQVLHGLIIVKIEHSRSDQVLPTRGWTCENNKCDRSLVDSGEDAPRIGTKTDASLPEDSPTSTLPRNMEDKVPEYCEHFKFEFSIDGSVTTWNREEWQKREQKAQVNVQLWTLLDDPRFTKEAKDVELAIRMTGCQRTKIMRLTHVYWA